MIRGQGQPGGRHFRARRKQSRAAVAVAAAVVVVAAGAGVAQAAGLVSWSRALGGHPSSSPTTSAGSPGSATGAGSTTLASASSQDHYPTSQVHHATRPVHHATSPGHHPTRPVAAGSPATYPGPDGVKASWVVAENRRPGTTTWQIGTQSGTTISGYANHTSAERGQQVTLYVSTAAPHFHVEAYRMGYYGGTGARLVWKSAELAGSTQAACPLTPATYTISCTWNPSVSFRVTAAWVQGDYLVKLVADPGQASYVPLTITDPASHAAYAVLNSVLTWQAWNSYGGYDCFQGPTGQLGPTDPIRSRVVSYDRPYDYQYAGGDGSADFLGLEDPVVRFVEEEGLDVTYVTDIDLTVDPKLVQNHKALISLGHNEFWTAAERQGIASGIAAGVNVVFLGATAGLRPARLEPSALGPDRQFAAYRSATQDPVTATDPADSTPNAWGDPPLDAPNSEIVGDTYGGYDIHAPMVITNPRAWPFANTGAVDGTQLPGVIGGDYDHYVPARDDPANVEILAHSPVKTGYGTSGDADMTYYTTSSGAGVLATGTITWVGYLGSCAGACPTVRQITGNVLKLFGAGPAGRTEPSVSNTAQYYS